MKPSNKGRKSAVAAIKVQDGWMTVETTVNGARQSWKIRPDDFLLDALRREGFKGAKKGCETGDCGSCAVLLDGKAVASCLLLAAQSQDREITTIEGLGTPSEPHPLQEAFVDTGGIQCGFCIPGMILSAKALLDRTPSPTEAEIRRALDGVLCRCTGYVKQVQAVKLAAERKK